MSALHCLLNAHVIELIMHYATVKSDPKNICLSTFYI